MRMHAVHALPIVRNTLLAWVFTFQIYDSQGFPVTWTSERYEFPQETEVTRDQPGQPQQTVKVPGCKEARMGVEGLLRQLYQFSARAGQEGYAVTACESVQ